MIKTVQLFSACFFFACLFNTTIYAQWVPVATSPTGFVTDHSYGFALDGKGYLVSGTDQNGNARDDFFQYDPVADEFTQMDDFPGGARGFAIGDTWDGKAYFGFGSANTTLFRDLWVFDPATMEWSELATCPCGARRHPAFVALNDKVFVGLGSGSGGDLSDWWIYDIPTDTWSQGAAFPAARRHHPYQFGIGDFVYVGFGHNGPLIYNEWYRFDPATNSWDEMTTLPAEGRVAGQQFAHNGKGYALSGEGDDHSAMDDGEFWEYDPIEDAWEEMPSHPGTSRWAPASFVLDNEVYLFGGIVYGFGPPTSMEQGYKFDLGEGDVMSSAPTLENNNKFGIYPNPAASFLNLQTNASLNYKGEFIISDMLGRDIMQFEFDNVKTINIESLQNGAYVISSLDGTISKQFIVARK